MKDKQFKILNESLKGKQEALNSDVKGIVDMAAKAIKVMESNGQPVSTDLLRVFSESLAKLSTRQAELDMMRSMIGCVRKAMEVE